MIQPFLITGLPRSRTAWLTALCNTVPGALCRHEPTQDWPAWQTCFTAWREEAHPFAGFSDHVLGLHLAEIVREIGPRVLVVERDAASVERALARVLPGVNARPLLAVLADRLRAARGLPGVKVVPFAALRHCSAALDCLGHLLPGAAIDPAKVRAMLHLNVQADMGRTTEIATQRAGDVRAILGDDVVQLLVEVV